MEIYSCSIFSALNSTSAGRLDPRTAGTARLQDPVRLGTLMCAGLAAEWQQW